MFSGKVSKTDITQSTGTSTTSVMSQKSVSDIVDELESEINTKLTDLDNIVIGGYVTYKTIQGNGSDQFTPLSELGLTSPCKVFLKVTTSYSNFSEYGMGRSDDGITLTKYTEFKYTDEQNGIGYIFVDTPSTHVVVTSAVDATTTVEFIKIINGIVKDVENINETLTPTTNKANNNEARLDVDEGVIFGTRPIFGELKGNGRIQLLSLEGLGFTSGTLYLKVINPAANFVRYGVASSKDGKTLYKYLIVTWDNEAFGLGHVTIDDSLSHIAITSDVGVGTNVYFFGSASDSLQQQIKSLKPKTFAHNAIVSFIDDDSGKYVPTIWGEILSASPIKMGFACVAGFMSGIEASGAYEPMQLSELRALYEQGHEVYSHTWTHPALYEDSVTLEELDFQCWKSRDWLYANGFGRNANTIVYSGGLGEERTDKQGVVRRHYKYGVDTVGGGINPEPLKNKMCIYRFNADTATLDELKAKVDEAVSKKALLVFMNHAYELNKDKTAQVQKMIDIINYIKVTNATILPLEQALNQLYGM